MPLDKAIKHGKERRKPYRRWKAIDKRLRNHGEYATRLARFRRRLESAQRDISDALAELDDHPE